MLQHDQVKPHLVQRLLDDVHACDDADGHERLPLPLLHERHLGRSSSSSSTVVAVLKQEQQMRWDVNLTMACAEITGQSDMTAAFATNLAAP